MDPNQNQNIQTPPVQNPMGTPGGTIPPPPTTPIPSIQTPNNPIGKSNGKVILFIAVGILLLIVLGVIYFMATQLNNQNKTEDITPIPTQALPTSTPTPTPLSEKDIDTIDLGNPETDLKSIEDDVKQL
ncbi:MAG: hypothetical protein A2868_00170 [Candidatus Levybacteria bacterium RIFCSPHIGHO2_01_FULL_40_15b]|nr:MAG: hypothetical protein A2868_00170 [Candidatus Levybacteria bacterium RIFCSPHIGHO2_01_FULL_40_15b]